MLINFSPVRKDCDFIISKIEDALIINDDIFDFGQLPEGAVLPKEAIDSEWFVSDIERVNGVLKFTLLLPHGPNPPTHVAFPEPLNVTEDGLIVLPTDEVLND